MLLQLFSHYNETLNFREKLLFCYAIYNLNCNYGQINNLNHDNDQQGELYY